VSFEGIVLHYKPEKSTACIVLHKICIQHNIAEMLEDFDLGMYHNQEPFNEHVNDNHNRNLMLRRHGTVL